MSLKKNNEGMGWIAICECGEELEIMDAQTMAEAARCMKQENWRIVKDGTRWYHQCPSCSTDEELEKPGKNKWSSSNTR
jgi:hypothetical protein